ncbi:alpha/beta hydrolase [Stenotrophomonas mori]|uniref:Alpha/beta fold hydrolase n=1 Tax=Stenotrophomonas mori TaxID=2871096 RepID=A0ABT0SF97_9GAMM|nr:alpha/beta fold hydrolase [Stenotrophomonas mori]MCL7713997.1 alpha/beta fold hydrolase [Stenotrophomonas mori]
MSGSQEFFFEGGRKGVLLIHGLTGTPMEMRLLGKGLANAGYTVHGLQLPGHCGDADALVATTWEDWYAGVEQAAEALRARVDTLFVGGLSMGAVLALALAAQRPELVAGVGVYGATFRYDGWNIPAVARLAFLLPLFKRLGIGRHRMFMEEPPYGLRDERIRAQVSAAMLAGDSAAAGLPGNPWPALAEMYRLSAWVKPRLPQVVAPCLIAHAREDDIASLGNARLVAARVTGPTRTLILDNSYHMITIDRERRLLIEHSARFFDAIASGQPLADAA